MMTEDHIKLCHIEEVSEVYDGLSRKARYLRNILGRTPYPDTAKWLEEIVVGLEKDACSLKFYLQNLGYDEPDQKR